MAELRAVIFDLDGIVAETEPIQIACYTEAFRRVGFPLSAEEYRQKVVLAGMPTRELFRSLGGNDQRFEEELLPLKDRLYRERVRRELSPRPGLTELLDDLSRHRVKTILATASRRRNAHFILETLGLADRFLAIYGLEDVLRPKPDPEVFLVILTEHRLSPDQVIALDDAPKGVRAAAGAGIRCVAVPTPATADGDFSLAWRRVESLTELSYRWLVEELEKDLG